MPRFIFWMEWRFQAERIYDMDLNRVESTTILKDASATALYGSRGANGVIVITTIRPKARDKSRINLNANYNVSIPDLRDYNLMNARKNWNMNAGPVYIPILFIQNRYDWKSFIIHVWKR